jgi:murein DD-endopeptidase MepM/ murein hydrolase activator NlpD
MEHKGSRAAALRASASEFLKKQGFYVVLGLCILCIGIAMAVALLPDGSAKAEPTPMSQAAGVNEGERLSEAVRPTPIATAKPVLTPSPTAAPAKTPAATQAPKRAPSKAAAPVQGDMIWGYAVDALLYSETLEQWTTHDGVDIAAKPGSEVHAIKGGTVQSVENDSLLGITVKIKHDGGLVSVYANLAENPGIEEGQKVNAGDKVGVVGDTAGSECAMAPHLHFALYKDGASVNPTDYVLLGD